MQGSAVGIGTITQSINELIKGLRRVKSPSLRVTAEGVSLCILQHLLCSARISLFFLIIVILTGTVKSVSLFGVCLITDRENSYYFFLVGKLLIYVKLHLSFIILLSQLSASDVAMATKDAVFRHKSLFCSLSTPDSVSVICTCSRMRSSWKKKVIGRLVVFFFFSEMIRISHRTACD